MNPLVCCRGVFLYLISGAKGGIREHLCLIIPSYLRSYSLVGGLEANTAFQSFYVPPNPWFYVGSLVGKAYSDFNYKIGVGHLLSHD